MNVKKYILAFGVATLLFGQGLQAAELSAREVMERVDNRYDGDTAIADYTMVLIDRRERQRSRSLRIYSKDYGEDSR